MREKELRECSTCIICGEKIGKCGLPMFWRIHIERHGIDLAAIQRQTGLTMVLGGNVSLATVMGPDEKMTVSLMDPVTLTICEGCTDVKLSIEDLAIYMHYSSSKYIEESESENQGEARCEMTGETKIAPPCGEKVDLWTVRALRAEAEVERMQEEADDTEYVAALRDAGVNMGDGENPQDVVTGIGLLDAEVQRLKRLVEALEYQRSKAMKRAFASEAEVSRLRALRDEARLRADAAEAEVARLWEENEEIDRQRSNACLLIADICGALPDCTTDPVIEVERLTSDLDEARRDRAMMAREIVGLRAALAEKE